MNAIETPMSNNNCAYIIMLYATRLQNTRAIVKNGFTYVRTINQCTYVDLQMYMLVIIIQTGNVI